jgi:hypothetical protein
MEGACYYVQGSGVWFEWGHGRKSITQHQYCYILGLIWLDVMCLYTIGIWQHSWTWQPIVQPFNYS